MSMIGNFLMINEANYKKITTNPDNITNFLYETDHENENFLDIDKTWHVIHYLLTGDVYEGEPPQRDVILGGVVIGDIDVGYGPARILDKEEVKNVSDYLTTISNEVLLSKYDEKKLNELEIYPGWENIVEDQEYIIDYFNQLKKFYELASQKKYYVIQYID